MPRFSKIEPLAFILPVRFQFSDSSISRSVPLVTTTAATETVQDTLAESTEQAADTGAHKEDGNPRQHEPNPDVGSTLTVQPQRPRDAGLLVAVSQMLQALVVHYAGFSPEGSKEAINLIFGILKSLVDVIFSVEEFSGG